MRVVHVLYMAPMYGAVQLDFLSSEGLIRHGNASEINWAPWRTSTTASSRVFHLQTNQNLNLFKTLLLHKLTSAGLSSFSSTDEWFWLSICWGFFIWILLFKPQIFRILLNENFSTQRELDRKLIWTKNFNENWNSSRKWLEIFLFYICKVVAVRWGS